MKTTEETIRKTIDSLVTRFATLRTRLLAEQKMYRLEFAVTVPEGVKTPPTKLGTAQEIVNDVVDHVLFPYMKVHARPYSDADKLKAEKRSIFLTAFWQMVGQQSQLNPLVQFAKYLAMSDVALLETVPDVDAYPQDIKQRDGESEAEFRKRQRKERRKEAYAFPIRVTAPNPAWCMWELGPVRPRYYCKRVTVMGSDLIAEYGEGDDGLDSDGGHNWKPDLLYTVEYWWDEETFALLVNNEFVIHRENDIGVPIAVKFGGDGSVDDENHAESYAMGLLTRKERQLISESETFNKLLTVTRNLTYPDYWVNDPSYTNIVPGSGLVRFKPESVKFELAAHASVDPSLFNMVTLERDILKDETMARTARGQHQPGSTAAAQTAIELQQLRMTLLGVIGAITGAIELSNVTVLRIIDEVFPDGIRVMGRTPYGFDLDQKIDSSDVDGAYGNMVELMAGPPEDLERQADASLRQYEKGAITLETHLREGLKRQDPETEMVNIVAEKAFTGPKMTGLMEEIAATLFQRALAEKGLTVARNIETGMGDQNGAVPEMTSGELAGTPTMNPPGSPEDIAEMQQEMQNAQMGQSAGMRRLVP